MLDFEANSARLTVTSRSVVRMSIAWRNFSNPTFQTNVNLLVDSNKLLFRGFALLYSVDIFPSALLRAQNPNSIASSVDLPYDHVHRCPCAK